MTNLYTESGLNEIEKNKKLHLFLMILSIVFAVASLITFTLLANYKTRTLFSILSSVTVTIFAFFSIYFISKYSHINRLHYEYDYLLKSTNVVIKGEILKCSDFLTTLPDRSQCYEVLLLEDGKEVIYYLSSLFDITQMQERNVKLIVFQDYIKGYEYED